MVGDQVPGRSWLHPHVMPRPSPIEGIGLFATRHISAGDVVMRLGGKLIDDEALGTLTPPYSSLCIGRGEHVLIAPDDVVRFGNHNCDPNLWHDDAITLVARRDILEDQEVTLDYATHTASPLWSLACRCKSARCRGAVTGSDWRIEELQQAYGNHWTPPLLELIATMTRD